MRNTRRVTLPTLIPTLAIALGVTLLGCSTSGTVADGGSGGETGSGGTVGTGGGAGGVKGSAGWIGRTDQLGRQQWKRRERSDGRRSRWRHRIRWKLGAGRHGRARRRGKAGHGRRHRNGRLTCWRQWRRRGQRRERWRRRDRRRGRHDRGITGPCDLYAAGNTPCVAAHSTVRALYGTYGGPLYQVRRASDKSKGHPRAQLRRLRQLVGAGCLLLRHHLHDLRHL